ncbi:MAG: hypothetical protein LBT26_03410 [Clostridiales Family XIII bacterium]|jgi:cellulose biosynthesis protein BcsQ|nr:hypothetical protein [Clostridiales Family XIII bacterium]
MSGSFVFHGIDNKVGTTMVAVSVAEALASIFPEKKVLFLALNGRESTEYVREEAESIDSLKSRLESRMLGEEELKAHCRNVRNLFLLGGVGNEEEERYYQPELASRMIELAGKSFDFTVIDSGNRLDNGLAFGALTAGTERYFLLTQQETLLSRWEKRRPLYENLGITPKAFIINNYMENDIYPLEYVARRIGADKDEFHKVAFSYEGRRAEIEHKTLRRDAGGAFAQDIVRLTESLVGGAPERDARQKRRKLPWKSFI